MSSLRNLVGDANAPPGLHDWLNGPCATWETCPRADWLLWLATRVDDLTADEQRSIIGAATEIWPDESTFVYLFAFFRPVPSRRDVLVAWSRAPERRFDFAHGLAASNHAFAVGLVVAILLDRFYLASWERGTTRTIAQTAVFIACWLVLILPMRWLRRRVLDAQIGRLTFDQASARAFETVTRAVAKAPAVEQAKQVRIVRRRLRALETRRFA